SLTAPGAGEMPVWFRPASKPVGRPAVRSAADAQDHDIEHGQAEGEGESRDHLDQWAQAAVPKDRGQKKRNVIIAEKDMLDTGARVLAALRRLPDEDRARDPGGRGIPSANITLCKEKLP